MGKMRSNAMTAWMGAASEETTPSHIAKSAP
jgi:hypothetical protein